MLEDWSWCLIKTNFGSFPPLVLFAYLDMNTAIALGCVMYQDCWEGIVSVRLQMKSREISLQCAIQPQCNSGTRGMLQTRFKCLPVSRYALHCWMW